MTLTLPSAISILVPVFMYSGLYINLNLTVALSPARRISSSIPLEFFLLSIAISLAVCFIVRVCITGS